MSKDLVKQALDELADVVRCRCHEAYTVRGLHDPNCECDSAESVKLVADRIEELEAENERLLDEAVEAVMSAAENMVYTATKRNGDRKLRFDAFEVEAELKGAAEYYASAIRALKKGGDA